VKKVLHPIICCAASAELTAVVFGFLSKSGLDPVLGINYNLKLNRKLTILYKSLFVIDIIKVIKLESLRKFVRVL